MTPDIPTLNKFINIFQYFRHRKSQILIIATLILTPIVTLAHGEVNESITNELQIIIYKSLQENSSINCETTGDQKFAEIGKNLLKEFTAEPETSVQVLGGIIGTGCISSESWTELEKRMPSNIIANAAKSRMIGALIVGLLAGTILGLVFKRKSA